MDEDLTKILFLIYRHSTFWQGISQQVFLKKVGLTKTPKAAQLLLKTGMEFINIHQKASF